MPRPKVPCANNCGKLIDPRNTYCHSCFNHINQRGSANHNWRGGRSQTQYVYRLAEKERDREGFLLKKRVRDAVRRAIQSGQLTRPTCQHCGKPMNFHHRTYSDINPFDGWFECMTNHRYGQHNGMGWNKGKHLPKKIQLQP
jgi:hypothetical protein